MSDCCGYFVTGTDTGVGKTMVTLGLMQCLQAQGHSVAAMKPVASGCERHAAGMRNADALLLQQQATVEPGYELVNPYAFEPAIAPHIAAAQAGVHIDLEHILATHQRLAAGVDCVLVEGVGGWQVPLNEDETLADLARLLGLDVVMVVAMRLGCLNHALLTAAAIEAAGCTLAGWVANLLPPLPECVEENIKSLKSRISAPLLGVLPEFQGLCVNAVAEKLSLPPLING
ncbi:MAG: dethiobiotin synthase [Gammaproteobacteria bacterium]|jgi:dethiobiotin synthetase